MRFFFFSFLLWPSAGVSLLESISFHFYFLPFLKVGPFVFLGRFRFRSFLAFFKVFAVGCVISFSWCWRRAALFSVKLFVCVLVCVFSSFRAFFGSFLALGAGRRAAPFFRRAFCVRFCLCFLFFSGFFCVPFWLWVLGAALLFFPSGFLCAFLFAFSHLFGLFWVPFWLWVLSAVLLFFPWGFLCAFLFVFSLLFGLFWVRFWLWVKKMFFSFLL